MIWDRWEGIFRTGRGLYNVPILWVGRYVSGGMGRGNSTGGRDGSFRAGWGGGNVQDGWAGIYRAGWGGRGGEGVWDRTVSGRTPD